MDYTRINYLYLSVLNYLFLGSSFSVVLLREHHLTDHWRRAAGTAAASQESEEEGEDTSRSVYIFLS